MFLVKEDLVTNVNNEIVSLLSRYSDEVVLVHLSTAEVEIESHLVGRYLIRPELEKVNTDRNKLLVRIGVNIATYYLYQTADTIPTKVEKAYERANELLKMLTNGQVKLPGVAPPASDPTETTGSEISYGTVARRPSLY